MNRFISITIGLIVFMGIGIAKADAYMLNQQAPYGVLLVPASTAQPYSEVEFKHYRMFVRNINRIQIGKRRVTKTTGRVITTPVPRTFSRCNRVSVGLGNGYRGDAISCK